MPPTLVTPNASHLSRTKIAFSEINRYAASPLHGATLDQIKQVHQVLKENDALPKGPISAPAPGAGAPQPDDLVNRLISDHPDLWNRLLNNPFCKQMGTTTNTSPTAPAFLNGFKAYMIQDYIYCARSISYQVDRALKTTKGTDFDTTADKAKNYCDYAKGALHLCIDAADKGLGINDAVVLRATPADVLDEYTEFQASTAEKHDWVMGLVAMIPCIQSYYGIAKPLYDNASADVKNTPWYKLWIKPNGGVTPEEAGVTGQISFFTANYAAWKDSYAEAKEIFRRACEGEIALWNYAEESMAA